MTLVLVLLAAAGCRRVDGLSGDEPVARVGDEELYMSDVGSIFTADMSAVDSVRLLESYVDMWVKKQLKVQEAEKTLAGSTREIDALVDEYRNSLLVSELDRYLVDRQIDTTVTRADIEAYYGEHRGDFLLDRVLVRGTMVRLPDSHRQKATVRRLVTAGAAGSVQDLDELAQKNGFEMRRFDTWADQDEFLSSLPVGRIGNVQEFLARRDVQEVRDGADTWIVWIGSRLGKGDHIPVERLGNVIRRVIWNQRRQEIIRNYEDSIYNAARGSQNVEINIKEL